MDFVNRNGYCSLSIVSLTSLSCLLHRLLGFIIGFLKSLKSCIKLPLNRIEESILVFKLKFLLTLDFRDFMQCTYEPRREKTGFLHMSKQRCRSASR